MSKTNTQIKREHSILFTQKSKTQQHSKDEVDVNKIMERYTRTGVIDHVNKHQPFYGDIPSDSYHESMNIVADANSMFQELPATVRKYFQNDPSNFLSYVQDPDNAEKLQEMGLTTTPLDKKSEAKEAPASENTRAPAGKKPKETSEESE